MPGLAAKPVADILAGIDDPGIEAVYLPDLEAAGYDLTIREPQRGACAPETPASWSTCTATYRPSRDRKLLPFQDHLRRNACDRRRYEAANGNWPPGQTGYAGTQPGPPGPAP